jgi:hypothetical protein
MARTKRVARRSTGGPPVRRTAGAYSPCKQTEMSNATTPLPTLGKNSNNATESEPLFGLDVAPSGSTTEVSPHTEVCISQLYSLFCPLNNGRWVI